MHPTIEGLRAQVAEATAVARWTAPQVRAVVDGVVACRSLDETAAAAGVPGTVVLDVIAEFGTWLTHVFGGSGARTVSAASVAQPPLFQSTPPAPATKAERRASKTGQKSSSKGSKVVSSSGRRRRAADQPETTVVVPPGFERSAPHGRDVSKSLASVVVNNPDDKTISRFLARKYTTTAKVLTFALVAEVWNFARLGRLDEIDQLNPNNVVLSELLVAAYDTLEQGRAAAMSGIATLCSGDISDLDRLAAAALDARWVSEGEISKLERLIDTARSSESARPLLAKELRFFAQAVTAAPARYAISDIADLNDAQVQRIGAAAGLAVGGSDRVLEGEVRTRLVELGLSADVDRLVPEGVRAISAGLGDVFWDAMERRAAADPDWDTELAEAFSTATVA